MPPPNLWSKKSLDSLVLLFIICASEEDIELPKILKTSSPYKKTSEMETEGILLTCQFFSLSSAVVEDYHAQYV